MLTRGSGFAGMCVTGFAHCLHGSGAFTAMKED